MSWDLSRGSCGAEGLQVQCAVAAASWQPLLVGYQGIWGGPEGMGSKA